MDTLNRFRINYDPSEPPNPVSIKQPEPNTTNQLLAQILDAINQQRSLDVPSDYTHHDLFKLESAAAGQFTKEKITQFDYVYIPKAPRDISIYYGHGTGQLLGAVLANNAILLRFPRVDALTFTYGATGTDTLDVWFSTRPIGVTKVT